MPGVSRAGRRSPPRKEARLLREFEMTDEGYAYLLGLRQCDPQIIRAEAERLFEEVISEYGDVPHLTLRDRKLQALLKQPSAGTEWSAADRREPAQDRRKLARKRTLGQEAEARLDELFNLAVGKPAPEIEGVDMDGKPLKLSRVSKARSSCWSSGAPGAGLACEWCHTNGN